MATLAEIAGLFGNNDMLVKVEGACVVAAEIIRVEDGGTLNHANRLIWAKQAFDNPRNLRDKMWRAMLAANKANAVGDITGANDAAIQAAVDAAVDVFADGS